MFKPDVLQLFLRDLFILSQFLPRYCSVNMSQAFPDPSINFFPVWERQTPLFLLRRLKQMSHNYYRLCSTTKRERFFAHVYFSNKTVSQTTVSTDQWKCFVWSTKLWMFVKETWHVLLTWSACWTKLTTFFRILEAWCHCDFRKIDALQENKFGQSYRTGTQTAWLSSRCEDFLFFLIFMRMLSSWNKT